MDGSSSFWGLNWRLITPSQSESLEAISPALRPPQKDLGGFLIDSARLSKRMPGAGNVEQYQADLQTVMKTLKEQEGAAAIRSCSTCSRKRNRCSLD
jgi:hypothetical protein